MPDQLPSPSMTMPRAMIGRWTVDQYLQFSRWWLLGGLGVLVLTAITHLLPGSALTWNTAIFFLVGLAVVRQHGGKTESLTAGALVGLVLGLADALVGFIAEPSVIAAVNIVAATLLTGLIGALIATGSALLAQLLFRHHHQ